jgi:hypothetical protein
LPFIGDKKLLQFFASPKEVCIYLNFFLKSYQIAIIWYHYSNFNLIFSEGAQIFSSPIAQIYLATALLLAATVKSTLLFKARIY